MAPLGPPRQPQSLSPTAAASPRGAPRPSPTSVNVAPAGTAWASWGHDTVKNGIDGDARTLWYSGLFPPQWYAVTLDAPYLVDRIELVVTQQPAGATTHEVWLGEGPGDLRLQARLEHVLTSDGQTLTVPVQPARVVRRVVVRTVGGPSQVGWRQVRVFGVPAAAGSAGEPVPEAELRPVVAGGLELPVDVTHAGDGSGRLFVVEQKGRVRVVGKDGRLRDRPFLDISARVGCCGERGLLGLAFPPAFAEKGHFYVAYTASAGGAGLKPGDLVVARFRVPADADAADPTSEEVVLVVPQPSELHHGGHLEFGPRDGDLYVGAGEGGPLGAPGGRAQDPGTLLGKMLRIDVEAGVRPYAVPPGNPFAAAPGYRPEIWALGLRNPWGFAFDRRTGDLYVADAGDSEWEEVDAQPASSAGGENYGWPATEGDHCFQAETCRTVGLTAPVAEYHHVDGCAVVGGAVARGPRYARLQGVFLYADFCNGRIWGLRRDEGRWATTLLHEAGFPVSRLGEGEDGEVYVADYAGGRLLVLTGAPP